MENYIHAKNNNAASYRPFPSRKVSPREFVSSLLIEFSIIPISFNFNYAEFRLIRGLVLIRVLLALTWSGRRSRWQTC